MDTRLIAGSGIAGLLCIVGHWFPWPRPLYAIHRTLTYMWGTAAILIGLAVVTERRQLARTAAVCATAGGATIATYIVDIHLQARQARRMYERHA